MTKNGGRRSSKDVARFVEDVCDTYASYDEWFGRGNFQIKNVPMPHAQCLCVQVQVVPELDDVADRLSRWVDGGEDEELDSSLGEWKAGKSSLTHLEMKVSPQTEQLVKIRKLTNLNLSLLAGRFGNLRTSETILTEEHAAHIRERHPEEYELFEKYGVQTILEPDLILVDKKHEGTILLIRKTEDTNLNAIVRLALRGEDEKKKNSVMAFYRIRDKNVEKLKKRDSLQQRIEMI